MPVLGRLFRDEPAPENGKLTVGNAPGFGVEIADRAMPTNFE